MQGDSVIIREKLKKLRRMRLISAGLLAAMAVIYIVFIRLEARGLVYSSIAAFAEAAMIGALADWFAVVALFRHPLGMKWIPHTAIIRNNKDRIGESIASFVVSNFFTADVIKSKLESVDLSREASVQLKKYRGIISAKLAGALPNLISSFYDNKEMVSSAKNTLKKRLESIRIYPVLGRLLEVLVSSGQHIPITKELLINAYNYISDNKLSTLRFIEGLNRTLALPVIGDIVYNNILKTLARQVEDIENNNRTEVNRMLQYSIPRLVERLKTSEELIEKGEKFKLEFMDSKIFDELMNKAVECLQEMLEACCGETDELKLKVEDIIDRLTDEILKDNSIRTVVDSSLKKGIINLAENYKDEIEKLIFNTVKNWNCDDMVNRLEVYVGAELQYIRINGTVIGGLAGLAIHLIFRLWT
ncbi:MAG: DUF445 domain-containing protein [Clostridia bacterium]|nr:DUF445 domain-containing protein [Clostridia bacterium]